MEFSQDVWDNLQPHSAGSNSGGKHLSGGGGKYGYNNRKDSSDSGISDYSVDASSRKTSTASSAGATDSTLEDIKEEPIQVQSEEALRKCKTIDWVKYQTVTVIKQVLFNNLAASFIVGYMGYIILLHLNGTESEDIFKTLPTVASILWQLPMLLVIHALLQLLLVPFYYPRGLMHHELRDGHVHNLHHEWTASVVMASTFAPPVEHIIKNLLPIAVGPMLLKCHVVTVWIWYNYAALDAVQTHSRYHLTWMISTKSFDSRCSKYNFNYDTQMRVLAWNFLDWLRGIMEKKLWTISGDGEKYRIHLLDSKSVLLPGESVKTVSKLNCKANAA